MRGFDKLFEVRRKGLKPISIVWDDSDKADQAYDDASSHVRDFLKKEVDVAPAYFRLSTTSKDHIERLDLRVLLGIEFVSIDSELGNDRLRAIHTKALQAGAKMVLSTAFTDGKASLMLLNDTVEA